MPNLTDVDNLILRGRLSDARLTLDEVCAGKEYLNDVKAIYQQQLTRLVAEIWKEDALAKRQQLCKMSKDDAWKLLTTWVSKLKKEGV